MLLLNRNFKSLKAQCLNAMPSITTYILQDTACAAWLAQDSYKNNHVSLNNLFKNLSKNFSCDYIKNDYFYIYIYIYICLHMCVCVYQDAMLVYAEMKSALQELWHIFLIFDRRVAQLIETYLFISLRLQDKCISKRYF